MEWWQAVLLVLVLTLLALVVTALWLWHKASSRKKALAERVQQLPVRARLQLAGNLLDDERIPSSVRLVLPFVILYLSVPLDLIPDFLPVVGQLDDILVGVVGAGMLMKFAPVSVMEDHITALEATYRPTTLRSSPPACR
jgi:uncharacterized membrane protein YkvA (DUF1232 family)